MHMSEQLEKKFNEQITLEFESSLVYRQLAIECDAQDLPGMAAWLRRQADEEIVHANKFIDHLLDRGNHPLIGAVPELQRQAEMTPLDVFKVALEHEQRVSASIRTLYKAAEDEADLDSRPLLNWFISEQLEEESTVSEIVGRLALTGDDGSGLLRLDEDLAARPVASTEPNA